MDGLFGPVLHVVVLKLEPILLYAGSDVREISDTIRYFGKKQTFIFLSYIVYYVHSASHLEEN